MSKITLGGWLKAELARMSEQDTASIHKLAVLAQEANPRLYEPLLVYALEIGASDRLLRYLHDDAYKAECQKVISLCSERSILDLGEAERSALPWSYRKLLLSWRAVEEKAKRTNQSKQLHLKRTKELMKEKGVKNSSIYCHLNLNPGNTNTYLKHDDITKLSLENATRIMRYLYSL
jgi:hypothetical protein